MTKEKDTVKFVCTECQKIYTRAVKSWYIQERLYCTKCQTPTLVEAVRVVFDDEGSEHFCKRPWKVYRGDELIYKAGYYGQGTRAIMLRFFTINENATNIGWETFKAGLCRSKIDKLRENMNNGNFKRYNE